MKIRKTNEEFQQQFYSKFDKSKFSLMSNYNGYNIPVKIRHECGYVFEKLPKNLMSKRETTLSCPICHAHNYNFVVQKGINDLKTLRPDVAELFKFPNKASEYRLNSHKKEYFICPKCGEESLKIIKDVVDNGFHCKKCDDGFSYPEKFMKSLLTQLKIDFTYQYSPEWIKPYRYDYYFEQNNKKYIIEMDGGLGHGNITINGDSDIYGKQIDNYKDYMALKYNIIVIRIDCYYTTLNERYNFIKNNIMNSALKDILDISKVEFSKCNAFAEGSMFIKACNIVNQGVTNFTEIAETLNVSNNTVRRYIKNACDSGYLNFDYNVLKSNSISADRNKNKSNILKNPKAFNRMPVRCIETGEIFTSMDSARKKYHAYIGDYLAGKRKSTGYLPDGTPLHWEKIENFNELESA